MPSRRSEYTTPFVHRDNDLYSTQPITTDSGVRAPPLPGGTLSQPHRLSVNTSVAFSQRTLATTHNAHLKQQDKTSGQPQKQRRALGDRTNTVAAASRNLSKSASMDWDYAVEPLSALAKSFQPQRQRPMASPPTTVFIAGRRKSSSAVINPLQHKDSFPGAATETSSVLYSRTIPITPSSSTFDPFGPYDLFGLHTPHIYDGSTEVDAATPHLHLTNIPPAMDSRVIVDILRKYGDIKKVYDDLLNLDRQLTVSFYDVRHAVLARQSLQAMTSSQFYNVHVEYMGDAHLAIRYNMQFEDSRASATVMLTMLGPRERLPIFDYKALLMKWGDIRTDVQLELSECRRTAQIEYFDRRCVPLVITSIHEQSFMNIYFHISLNAVVSGGIATKHRTFESLTDKGDTQPAYTLSLKQPVPLPIGQHLSAPSTAVTQHRHLYSHTINPFDAIIATSSSLPEAQTALSSLTAIADIPGRAHNDMDHRTYGNVVASEETRYHIFPRASSDPESVDTQVTDDDERIASSPSTFTFVTAPSLSPCEEPQAWTPAPSRSIGIDNEFRLERIMDGTDTRTTFMIRNIPNKYTQAMLRECIDATNKGTYDFLYLRIDFQNRCNVGYAFINFIDVKSVASFARERLGKRWNRFNSEKRCSLSYANIQGKKALMEKFRNSTVMEEDESFRPKIFYSSGPLKGEEETFPPPAAQSEPRRHHRADGRRRRGAI